jgi:hypothetical protein
VLVVTGILIADFGEHESRNENTASEKENCENRKKYQVFNLAIYFYCTFLEKK